MDWSNLTPIQLMALGANEATCNRNCGNCNKCQVHKARGELNCAQWASEHPEEALKLYGLKIEETAGSEQTVTLALAEALSAKEALEVDLGDLKAVNGQLREENAALLKERDEADVGLEQARKAEEKLRANLKETERIYHQATGYADGLLEALKIVHGSQT